MRRIIRGVFGLVAIAAVVASGCSEKGSPVGLEPGGALLDAVGTSTDESTTTASDTVAISGDAVAVDATVKILPRDVPLAAAIRVSRTIGTEGGKIELPESGLKIHIPNGALTQATEITVTALAGSGVAYEFQPHGLTFLKPLVAVQSFKLTGTTVPSLQGAYFPDQTQLDLVGLTGRIKERQASEMKVSEKKVKFNIPHFSGYLLMID